MTLGLDEGALISIIIESLLFGFFSILFAMSSYLLYSKDFAVKSLRIPFLGTSLTMYVLATIHLAINIQRTINGFIRYGGGGTSEYFTSDAGTLYLLKSIIYVLQTLLADGIMVYRLCVLFIGDKRIIIPATLLWIGNLAAGIGSGIALSKTTSILLIGSGPRNWLTSLFLIAFLINLGGTILIALRIWWIRRALSGPLGTRILLIILLDPGIIYSVSLICLAATYLSGSAAQLMLLEWMTQIIGIFFSLIIIRTGFNGLSSRQPREYMTPGLQTRLRTSSGFSHPVQKPQNFGVDGELPFTVSFNSIEPTVSITTGDTAERRP